MICTVACQKIEVVRFLGSFHLCLFLNYVNQTKFLTTTVIIFVINNKTRFTYFNPLISGVSKRSNKVKQTYRQKQLFILSMYELLLPPCMSVLKGGTVKEKSFCEFLILALIKEN